MAYFEGIRKLRIEELVRDPERLWGHTRREETQEAAENGSAGSITSGQKVELLSEHTDRCEKYFLNIVEAKDMERVFERFEEHFLSGCSEKGRLIFREMLYHVILLHDLGKINPCYQKDRLGNDLKISTGGANNSHHSMLSAILFMDIFREQIQGLSQGEQGILLDFLRMNGYVISKHHGRLDTISEFEKALRRPNGQGKTGEGFRILTDTRILFEAFFLRQVTLTPDLIHEKILKPANRAQIGYGQVQRVYRMFYCRLMLSLLVACDYYAATEFMDGLELGDFGAMEIESFAEAYRQGPLYQSILSYQQDKERNGACIKDATDINQLRSELFLEAQANLEWKQEAKIYYLEAPTGSGKSNTAMNLAFRLLEEDRRLKKIVYVYPFNTLVEQNYEILKKSFGETEDLFRQIAVINSATPIKMDQNRENGQFKEAAEEVRTEGIPLQYYKEALLNHQFLNYPMVLTTHVSFFRYLFGVGKEDVFPMHQLANSVIVLDEIQSYRNQLWPEIINFLNSYAELLNCKVIIMSATLPNLDFLDFCEGKTARLIEKPEEYYRHPLFYHRVHLDFSLLDSDNVWEDLISHVSRQAGSGKKILVEFITKKHAEEFYQELQKGELNQQKGCVLRKMTGDTSIAQRSQILKELSEYPADAKDGAFILIATQVVEAGVDIDMDLGYKNISMLDSEEQFLGRINRSCRRNGTAYFFSLDEASQIYKGDARVERSWTLREEKMREILQNKDFSAYYLPVLGRIKKVSRKKNLGNVEDFFAKVVGTLDFTETAQRMTLIDDDQYRVSVFLCHEIETMNGVIDGYTVWCEYRDLLQDTKMDYAERMVKLSQVRAEMGLFTYEIAANQLSYFNDRIGELFCIIDGETYFADGDFDRSQFVTHTELFVG